MITFDDQIKQLADSFIFNQDKNRLGRLAKRAVASAYADISAKSSWFYLRKLAPLNLSAAYNTGTIAYDATTRVLTLTDGTFPTNAVDSEVMINRNIYQVQTRTDATHLVLKSGFCPVSDIAAGTSYSIAKTKYLLPADYIQLRGLTELERLWRLSYVTPEVMLQQTQLWFTPCESWYFTIIGGPGNGRMMMQFAPPPIAARTLYISYQAAPRPRTLANMYSTGRVATTEGSTTVTLSGTGAAFPTNLGDGNVFRLGESAVPTGVYGEYPYIEEKLIKERTDATHIELWEAADTTATNACYSVDDPIDIQYQYQTFFDRFCEMFLTRLHQGLDQATYRGAEQAAQVALDQARAADSRLNPAANVNPQETISFGAALMLTGVPVP